MAASLPSGISSYSSRTATFTLPCLICLLCLLVSCAAENATSPETVTERVSGGVTQRVTEGVTKAVKGRVTDRVTDRVAALVPMTDSYPSPWKDPDRCRRTGSLESWLCDVDGVLSMGQADDVDALLVNVNTNASCVCNCSSNNATYGIVDESYVLGVAVVRTLPVEDMSSANRTYHLERFSDSVRHDWFADRICDDSALILAEYMYKCSKIHISLGDVLQTLLSNQSLDAIYDSAQPSLDTGDVGQALLTTVQELNAAIENAMTIKPPPANNLVWGILGMITVSSILLFHYWIKY